MTQPNIPKNLPFLPGMSYADPTLTRYHKTQILDLKNGIITEKTTNLQEPINEDLLASMKQSGGPTLAGTRRPAHQNDSIPRVAPKWLKHDR
jgi:hypothetical protein